MKIKLRKIGNSCGIILPKDILDLLGLSEGNEINLKIEGNSLNIVLKGSNRSNIK